VDVPSSLVGKIALVTGSTSGIGLGIAEHFVSLGARVMVHGRKAEPAQAIAARLRSAGHEADSIAGDLGDVQACRDIVRFTIQRFGGIDVLVNNAANTSRGYLEDVDVELWNTIMHVNLRAPFLCLQEAVTSMKTRGGGSIVNIGSVNAYIGEPKLGPYSVSKGGLMTLTRNAASTLNRYRIRVNQINVGWTLTEGEERVKRLEGKGEDWVEEAVATRPFGRLLLPKDVAIPVAYFASDDSALVTGTVMDLEQYPVGAPPNW
jgi:NAD(P)-dependent dehydrogenase (short-subunit alcohol dehydrogenase family)